MRTSGSPIRGAALAALALGLSSCADNDRDYYPREPTYYEGRYYGGYYGPSYGYYGYDYYGYGPGYFPQPYVFVRPRRGRPPDAAPPPGPPPDRGPGGIGGLVGRLAPPGGTAGSPPPRPLGPLPGSAAGAPPPRPSGPPPGSGGGIGGIVGRLAPPGGGRPQRPSD